ncbi:heparinase II/III family protein [Marinovum algicola]|uniref:heparinase II/III family protein n=1 Tax=Marinovum algicola TaxID=42444 RepID=UPI0024B9947A|nr:heparinase II/III family protein [Marinovum algicola]
MSEYESWSARQTRLMHRVHARLAARARAATAFVSQPEPRTIGSFNRGRQLIAGNLMFAGHLIEAKGAMLWDLDPPDQAFLEQIHGFGWLDDLAAVGDLRARTVAQDWLWGWIDRYGRGSGPGWTPDLTGRRLIRWTHHAIFLLRALEPAQSAAYFQSLAHQTRFLGRRWHKAAPGLPRFEALTGLLYAGLSLSGMERHVGSATAALARECTGQIDDQGGIPTRNPEELLEVFTLLTWAAAALEETGNPVAPEHQTAITRIAPTLRALRHSDGGLARFHGGGRGLDGRLDQALSASGVRKGAQGLAMGFARLSAGRTSVIVDASPPPEGAASFNAHASTLAFELTSGRRPLIVSCGSGAHFGEDWRRAGRATPSHSTLALEGYSSARLGREGRVAGARREMLEDAPEEVPVEIGHASDGLKLEAGHDGYVDTHGLTHARILELTFDGRGLVGEDMLLALKSSDRKRFDRVRHAAGKSGIPYHVRFHLHPDVDAEVDMGGMAVSLALRSGEVWVFRHEGGLEMTLEPSVYLEMGRLRPRATKQIVLSHRAMEYATRIRWSLAKAHDTAVAVRDLTTDDEDYDFDS